MKQSDEQIIATVRKILDILHDPNTGFNAFRKELRNQGLKTDDEQKQPIVDKELELAEKYGLTKENDADEIKFRLSGKDVMDSHLYVSCGQAAKAFCYANSQLPKEEQLDLKVLFSTDIEHLIDAKEGHTLPCVKLSDGKWHAIEPQIQPEKDKQPGFEFVCDDVKVDGEIWHTLPGIKKKGRPYQITKIVTPEEQATTYSDFGKFLEASMVHKGKLAFLCPTIKLILQSNNLGQYKDSNKQIYEFCKALSAKNNPSIQILVFSDGKRFSCMPCIKEKDEFYGLNLKKKYLSFWKGGDLEQSKEKFAQAGYTFQKVVSPEEYIKEFEEFSRTMSNINNHGRE